MGHFGLLGGGWGHALECCSKHWVKAFVNGMYDQCVIMYNWRRTRQKCVKRQFHPLFNQFSLPVLSLFKPDWRIVFTKAVNSAKSQTDERFCNLSCSRVKPMVRKSLMFRVLECCKFETLVKWGPSWVTDDLLFHKYIYSNDKWIHHPLDTAYRVNTVSNTVLKQTVKIW